MNVVMDGGTSSDATTSRAAHRLLQFLHDTTDATWSISQRPLGIAFPLESRHGNDEGFLCMSTQGDEHRYQALGEAVAMSLMLILDAEAKMPRVPRSTDAMVGLGDDPTEGRIVAYFQPIVALQTGEVVAIEALARMQTPDGVLGPEAFLSAFTSTESILALFDRMLESTLHFLSDHRHRMPDLSATINFELAGIPEHGLADLINRRLVEFATDPDALSLELNERVAYELSDAALEELRNVIDLGVKLLIDDVPSSFRTLERLQGIAISGAKLDRRFVQQLAANDPTGTEVAAVMARAAEFGIEVIAEGVETQMQCDKLIQLGCNFGQGYFFAVPQPASSLATVLEAPLVGTW
jgi:EAL domain-containing protein (putative c-di-GMP-specific phosphodiesterase class I)